MKLTKKARRWLREIRAEGYTVRFVPYCEDAETPGFVLGAIMGVTDTENKTIKIKTRRMNPQQIEAALHHELAHARGAMKGPDYPHLGMYCGGCVNPLGTKRL